MDQPQWRILFFETNEGKSPVYDFIKKQQPQARSKITHLTDLLSQYGNMLGLPHSKVLGDGLHELRIRGKEEIRIFYCFMQQKTICFLHAFKKQTQKTPLKELHIALQREKEVIKRV